MISPSRLLLLLPLLVMIALGCKGSRTPSKVHGKVTYKGQLITGGNIAFHHQGEDQSGAYSFPIQADGTYSGVGLPATEMIVTIETESANPKQPKQTYGKGMGADDMRKKMVEKGVPGASQTATGKYVEIPRKYADKEKSGLKKTLTSGDNELNFDLTD